MENLDKPYLFSRYITLYVDVQRGIIHESSDMASIIHDDMKFYQHEL